MAAEVPRNGPFVLVTSDPEDMRQLVGEAGRGANLLGVRDFDPLHLRADASVNRLRVASLPGADGRLVGRTVAELLALPAIHRLAIERGVRSEGPATVVRELAGGAAGAEPVVRELGSRLGHVLATLRSGRGMEEDGVSRWRRGFLAHWSLVERIVLGGGVIAGLGEGILPHAQATLGRLTSDPPVVNLAAYPAELPLIGAARLVATAPNEAALVMDFGHSNVKRAVARYEGGRLTRLELLPPLAAKPLVDAQGAEAFAKGVAAYVAEAHATEPGLSPLVRASVANYVADGWPLQHDGGMYHQLAIAGRQVFEDRLAELAGQPLTVRFFHDGSAAACGITAPDNAGVLVLGTSLGSGFPAPPASLVSAAAGFQMVA